MLANNIVPQIAIIGGLSVGFVLGMVAIIAHYWHLDQKLHADNMMRRTLAERGLPTEDIERIMAAGRDEER